MARIIADMADIAEGVAWLRRIDPRLAAVHDVTGDPPLRRSTPGFEGLAGIIVAQQVSTASAGAIWSRCLEVFRPMSAATILAAPDEDFRRAGLSRPKVAALRAAAAASLGGLDLDGLAGLDADAAHAALTAVKGIGPWTADVYLLFCLGHADAFAAGDLALREAARAALGLGVRPSAAELVAEAEAWRPWRGVAARLLWAYYRHIRAGRDGAPIAAKDTS